jgi:hypothetical protein
VKDFVRDVWKNGAVCAAGAFIFSLVIGLIAGNPFGIAFFRAMLFALIFAGLGVALRIVVKNYLPELVVSTASTGRETAAATDSENRGATVDIVLPEEEGLRRDTYGTPGADAGGLQAGSGEAESDRATEEALDVESMDGDSSSQANGELAEQLEEELPAAPEGRSRAARKGGEPVEKGGASHLARESAREVDSLPDIAALELPAGQGPAPSFTRSASLTGAAERPEDAVRNVLSGQDPATLARALRTVLKKDEKG